MPSESQTEAIVLAGQLNAFAAAQELRETVAARDKEIVELKKQVAHLKSQLPDGGIPPAPMLLCLCCDEEMAPATTYENGVWEWSDGDKATCDHCGWEGRVAADGNGQRAVMEEFEDEVPDFEDDAEPSEDEEF